MCVDSAVRPDDMQGPPVGLWPCHQQGGNQVFYVSKFSFFCLVDCCGIRRGASAVNAVFAMYLVMASLRDL